MRGTTVDPVEIGAVASELASVDESLLERIDVLAGLRDARRLRGFADACEAALARRLDSLDHTAPHANGNTSCAADEAAESDSLFGPDERSAHQSERDRERTRRRGDLLGRCALIAAALEAGWVSTRHVDVLAGVVAGVEPAIAVELLADEQALVDFARTCTPDTFGAYLRQHADAMRADGGMPRLERQRRDSRASCTADPYSGMYRMFGEFDPERGSAISQAVQHRVDRLYQSPGATDGLSPQRVRAQAVYELITRSGDGEPCSFDVLVVVDHESLTSGVHAATVCETAEGIRLPIDHVRTLSATATVTAAIVAADGKALAVGRCERIANRAQRRALRGMYRTCAHPGCTVTFDRCHIHHVEHWDHGGPTDLDNIIPLCHRHHHQVHDGGWNLTIDAARTLRWYRPEGSLDLESAFEPLIRAITAPAATDIAPCSIGHDSPLHGRGPPR